MFKENNESQIDATNNLKAINANMKQLNLNSSGPINLTTQVLDKFEPKNTLYDTVDDNDEIVELGLPLAKKNSDELDVIDLLTIAKDFEFEIFDKSCTRV